MKSVHLLLLCLAPLFFACNSDEPAETPGDQPAASSTTDPASTPAASPADTPAAAPQVRLETTKGNIVIELDPENAPITVKNFLGYVERKHYDGTVFHRVIDGFMIQGGGFAAKDGQLIEKRTGAGIKNEAKNGLKNTIGTIAMARTGDPNSATAQFYINVGDNVGLNYPGGDGYGYAVFGKVIEGMSVVDTIKAVPTTTKTLTMLHPVTGQALAQEAPNVPQQAVVINRAVVVGTE